MNKKKLPVDELTRLAFVWAEQDRSSLAQCWPPDSPERAEAESEYQQLKAYRKKRWGRTEGDRLDEIKTFTPIESPFSAQQEKAPDSKEGENL